MSKALLYVSIAVGAVVGFVAMSTVHSYTVYWFNAMLNAVL